MDLKATYARIGEYIESHPSESYAQIGTAIGLSRSQMTRIAKLQGIKRQPGKSSSALEAAIAAIEATSPNPDCAPAAEAAPPPVEASHVALVAPLPAGRSAAVANATDSVVVSAQPRKGMGTW
jgi:hypothetical protein